MGFYIETPVNVGKDKYLKRNNGALEISTPKSLKEIPEGKILICVISNTLFEAAAICFNQQELNYFKSTIDDRRPRRWLLMDKDEVIKLCPLVEQFLK